MPTGLILLTILALLVIFGFAHRVLDRMGLKDSIALIFIIAMIVGSFLPDIPLGPRFSINIGGAVIPTFLCIYLFVKAGTIWEKARAIIASLISGVGVYFAGVFLPSEPELMVIDPKYIYIIISAAAAFILGRSRRCAFIAGVMGIILSDIVQGIVNIYMGIPGVITLGGAGILDLAVLSGIFAVILVEVIGESRERLQGGTAQKRLGYDDGKFVKPEMASSFGTQNFDNKDDESILKDETDESIDRGEDENEF